MKLWLLRPRRDLPAEDDPWEKFYDCAFGFVVRAETEEEARSLPISDDGDDLDYAIGTGEEVKWRASPHGPTVRVPAWTDPRYSTCTELTVDGPAKIIIRDFRAG